MSTLSIQKKSQQKANKKEILDKPQTLNINHRTTSIYNKLTHTNTHTQKPGICKRKHKKCVKALFLLLFGGKKMVVEDE